jgi:hypothetical protein
MGSVSGGWVVIWLQSMSIFKLPGAKSSKPFVYLHLPPGNELPG